MTGGSGTPGALPLPRPAPSAASRAASTATHGLINPDFMRVAGASGDGRLTADRPGDRRRAAARRATRPARSRIDSAPRSRRSTARRRPTRSRPIRSTPGWSSPMPPRARSTKAEPGTPAFRVALRDAIVEHQGSGRHARRLQLQARQRLRRRRARARDRRARQRHVEDLALHLSVAVILRRYSEGIAMTPTSPHPRHRRPRQRRGLPARRARPGADLLGDAGRLRAVRRRRRVRRAQPGRVRDRAPAGDDRPGRDARRARACWPRSRASCGAASAPHPARHPRSGACCRSCRARSRGRRRGAALPARCRSRSRSLLVVPITPLRRARRRCSRSPTRRCSCC